MKHLFLSSILSLFFFVPTVSAQVETAQDKWADYVDELKTTYLDESTPPLDSAELAEFKGIQFYDYNTAARVEAKVKMLKGKEAVGFPTSTERIAYYRPYALLKFKYQGKKMKLTIYQSAKPIEGYEDYLFLPFSDYTSGADTYGAGRYMDMSTTDLLGRTAILDFNFTYHPYCAYSHRYSCPISPEVNALPVELLAGVRL